MSGFAFTARTHIDLNYDNRLERALYLCDHLVQALPIAELRVEKGGGGNWDNNAIENIIQRLGLSPRLSAEANLV